MTDVEALHALVAQLQETVRRLQDQAAIAQLVAAYGPWTDAGWSEAVATLWTEDAVYDADVAVFSGRDAIAAMIDGDTHQAIIHGGSAHVVTAPHISVDRDTAVATCHGLLVRHDGDGFHVARVTAIRFDLVRTGSGWRIANRRNRLLDGNDDARALLRGVSP
jgi:hypothetical protein